MEEFLKVEEVAEILKLNKMTIYRWIKKGKIKVSKMGRIIRISKSELERFLNESKEKRKK